MDDAKWEKRVQEDLCRYFKQEVREMTSKGRQEVAKVVSEDRPFLHAVLWTPILREQAGMEVKLSLGQLLDRDGGFEKAGTDFSVGKAVSADSCGQDRPARLVYLACV